MSSTASKNKKEIEQIIKRINDLLLKEKVGNIDISISFGYATKSNEEEKNEIRKCSGTQFDPTIARVFIEKVLRKEWE